MALTRRKKKKEKSHIKTQPLVNLLQEVYLNGVIDECCLHIGKGKGYIQAVDITNNLVVVTDEKIASSDTDNVLGLGNINLLIKFLSSIEDEKINFKLALKDTHIKISRKDKRRTLSYQLTRPDLIATRLDEDQGKITQKERSKERDKLINMTDIQAPLTPSFIKDFLSYITLIDSKNTVFKYDGEDILTLTCGDIGHKFIIELGNPVENNEQADEFSITINGEHLSRIFSVINFDQDSPPDILLAEDKPVVIRNKKTTWALVPLVELETGDE